MLVLLGLRAGRVRLIFELPPQYGRLAHPLLYIEWYTPFTSVNDITQMYVVQRSTRGGQPNATILDQGLISHNPAPDTQDRSIFWTKRADEKALSPTQKSVSPLRTLKGEQIDATFRFNEPLTDPSQFYGVIISTRK